MRVILIVLFFLSGSSALIYQVAWLRMLTLLFGVTSFAVATVLSSFMAGLAIGSYYGGRFVDRWGRPLLLFCILQLGIGAFALLFPLLYEGLSSTYVFLYQTWPTNIYFSGLIRFALSFGLLLIPTTMMGATLPVVVKHFVRDRSRLGSRVGILYSANNWGAVLGGLSAGFLLIEAIGVRETSYLAAAISMSIGIVAFFMHGHSPDAEPGTAREDSTVSGQEADTTYPRYVIRVVLWVFIIEGFTSLAYEVVWTRILAGSLIVSTTYAYSLVVATFIAGLALGSLLIARFVDSRRDLLSWLAGIEVGIGISALLLLPLFSASDAFATLLGQPSSWSDWAGTTAVWLAILMLVPTTLMGSAFPLVGKIYTANLRERGRRIGQIGCLDTAGSIFGAFAGGFILIPLLGMQTSVLSLALINITLGMAVVVAHPDLLLSRKAVIAVLLALLAGGAYMLTPHTVVFQPWCIARGDITKGEGWHVVDYYEGVGSTVTVSRTFADDAKLIQVDGSDVAGTGRPLETTQITQAHLPMLIYEAQNGTQPERALTIGMGSGGTCWSLSRYDLEEIHCVELVSGILKMAKKNFREVNHDVFSDPRFSVYIQDARAFVRAADQQYDIIMDDSVHPGFQGNASLYSMDFFRQCRERLTEGGVMSVWMPIFLISTNDLKMIFRSFRDVFPHATLWRANNDLNKHMVLIGTQEKLSLDFEKFRDRMAVPAIRDDLARVDLDDVYTHLNCFLLDEDALAEYCGDGPVHSDDHPYLAFSAARNFRRYWNDDPWMERVAEMRAFGCTVLPYVTNLGETEEEVAYNTSRLSLEFEVANRINNGYLAFLRRDFQDASREGMEAVSLNPDDKSARLLLSQARYNIAVLDWLQGRKGKAESEFASIIASDPNFYFAHYRLAMCHWQRREIDDAIRELQYAMRVEPGHESNRYWLAGFYAAKGMRDEAKTQLEKVLAAFPGEPHATEKLEQLATLRGQ